MNILIRPSISPLQNLELEALDQLTHKDDDRERIVFAGDKGVDDGLTPPVRCSLFNLRMVPLRMNTFNEFVFSTRYVFANLKLLI